MYILARALVLEGRVLLWRWLASCVRAQSVATVIGSCLVCAVCVCGVLFTSRCFTSCMDEIRVVNRLHSEYKCRILVFSLCYSLVFSFSCALPPVYPLRPSGEWPTRRALMHCCRQRSSSRQLRMVSSTPVVVCSSTVLCVCCVVCLIVVRVVGLLEVCPYVIEEGHLFVRFWCGPSCMPSLTGCVFHMIHHTREPLSMPLLTIVCWCV